MNALQIDEWRDAYPEFQDAVTSVAAFSQVDGAVILNKDLNVLGFGAKLSGKDDEQSKTLECRDPWSGLSDPTLRQRVAVLGTRHSSAFAFCCANPGTIAFVLSQDGDVRIFYSDCASVTMVHATDYVAA